MREKLFNILVHLFDDKSADAIKNDKNARLRVTLWIVDNWKNDRQRVSKSRAEEKRVGFRGEKKARTRVAVGDLRNLSVATGWYVEEKERRRLRVVWRYLFSYVLWQRISLRLWIFISEERLGMFRDKYLWNNVLPGIFVVYRGTIYSGSWKYICYSRSVSWVNVYSYYLYKLYTKDKD